MDHNKRNTVCWEIESVNDTENRGPPRGFGDSGRRAIYFQGFGEKGHLFSGIWGALGVLGSREQRDEEKHFRELGRKVIFLSGSREQRPPPPPLGRPQNNKHNSFNQAIDTTAVLGRQSHFGPAAVLSLVLSTPPYHSVLALL